MMYLLYYTRSCKNIYALTVLYEHIQFFFHQNILKTKFFLNRLCVLIVQFAHYAVHWRSAIFYRLSFENVITPYGSISYRHIPNIDADPLSRFCSPVFNPFQAKALALTFRSSKYWFVWKMRADTNRWSKNVTTWTGSIDVDKHNIRSISDFFMFSRKFSGNVSDFKT